MPKHQFDRPLALKDQVYRILRDRVRQGALAPGERLVDATLARDMNISRTPVREALQLLVHEGLLDPTTRGFKLYEPDQAEVAHLFELRLLLEPALAAKAAQAGREKEKARLLACVSKAADTVADPTPDRFNTAIYRFFEILVALCDNRVMAQSVLLYHDRLAQLRVQMMADPLHRALAADGYTSVAQAIVAQDAEATCAAAERHIRAGIATCKTLGLMAKDETDR
ncbi:hypothetical protein BOO69_20485 (plasmid) [Sulfitobacter alexandrii]|uniref:HTH gntR-type domain-containing protein n=1 Tax=Sulfitobacter alexandrii TaxID=1917485 RepID=A0A1J0WNX6_9RHOB|nr:GntR family transcriptional regulator [Sulfitobacter alexandrii]APE45939.1 hypothetical protein BOO69_20485 [Sulfitobacter alexandrii]